MRSFSFFSSKHFPPIFLWAAFLFIFLKATAQPSDFDKEKTLAFVKDDSSKIEQLLQRAYKFKKYFQQKDATNYYLQQALNLALNLNYTRGLAEAYDMKGVLNREKSRYIVAEEYHQKALAYAQAIDDKQLICTILNNMGVAYRRLDENQKAFEVHFQALQIAEEINDKKNIAIAINSLGNIQLATGNYKDAIDKFFRALQIEKDRKNDLGIAINYGNMGLAYEAMGQEDKAIDYYLRSLNYNIKIGSKNGELICYNSLGQAYEKKGRYLQSLQYLHKALAVSDQIDDRIDVAESYINIGKVLGRQKKTKEAVKNVQKGLNIALQISSKSMAMAAYQAFSDIYRGNGNFEKSLNMMKRSLDYKDSMVNEKTTVHLAEMGALYNLNKKENKIKSLQQENEIHQLQSNRNMLIALSLIGFVILLIIGGLFFLRHHDLKAHKKSLQLELRSLRSQMNPHFLFNSLNSIHKYIWSNQTEEASEYLTKFSRLIRMILENTQLAAIALSKELESLSLYLELESLRCNHKFQYIICVDPAIDQEDIMIPPLVIQPFVENAIWHGLVHKDEQGNLNISIQLKKNMLVCTVEDDGIGREKAMEIKKRKQPLHQSFGMRVTEDRIKLMKEVNGNELTNITVEDLSDKQGDAAGTRVVIQLPAEFLF